MNGRQNSTLALVMILLVVLMFIVITPIRDFIGSLFNYRHVELDLNPINPNFDPSTLIPKVPNPFGSNPQPSQQTPNGVGITDPNTGEIVVVPGSGGDPQIAPGVG